jgi:hypothetical protein
MNRVVVIGAIIVAVVVAILAVGILSANHQNNNYTSTSMTTYTSTSVILNTNTTTTSTTSTSTSTSTTSTNTTTNTTTKIQYNTFYFLNQTGQNYYYVFVLSYNEYETIMNHSTIHVINYILFNLNYKSSMVKTVVVGNYAFLITCFSQPFQPTIGHQYIVMIYANYLYAYRFTYEGNWEGPSL